MSSVKEYIAAIRKRPKLYFGRNSILLFQAYLYGWMNRDESSLIDSDLMGLFQEWIIKKYDVKSSHSWADIILFYEIEENKALDKFFKLWDEFLTNQEA